MSIRMSGVKSLVALAAFSVVGLAGASASADYVCEVSYRPYSGTIGTEGHVSYTTYTGVDCTGTLVQQYYLCSSGASSANCTTSTLYRYERQGLLAVFAALQRAAVDNQNVVTNLAPCIGSTTLNCASYPRFR